MRPAPLALLGLSLTLAATSAEAAPPKISVPPALASGMARIGAGARSLLQDAAELGTVFLQHPKGDTLSRPCEHRTQNHPDGDPGGNGPCLHAPVQEHPGGHEEWTPCADPRHATRSGPCGGHRRTVPCVHMKKPHGSDPLPRVPCVHFRAEHPGGHPETVPCAHEVNPVENDTVRGLVFYECDAGFRAKVKAWADRLRGWGVKFGNPRPLHVFNRPFRDGPYPDAYAGDAVRDPFWSHYSPIEKKGRHYLQVAREHGDATAAHELGHAITGDKCVVLMSLGGSHKIEDEAEPGLALSEGWANFVSGALLFSPGAPMVAWPFSPTTSFDLEAGRKVGESIDPPRSQKRELSVAYALWDLFDTRKDGVDTDSLGFAELFKVFRPTLATLTSGPVVPDFRDFAERLSRNEPKKAAWIRAVRDRLAP